MDREQALEKVQDMRDFIIREHAPNDVWVSHMNEAIKILSEIPKCKFRSPTNCDFCAFHSDCDEHWKEGGMENVEELIDFCLRRPEIDCFTDEQFKIRETYYDIISQLRKTSNENVGEWILSGNSEKYGGYCSKCHVDMPTYKEDWKLTYKATKFCPGCGARMINVRRN